MQRVRDLRTLSPKRDVSSLLSGLRKLRKRRQKEWNSQRGWRTPDHGYLDTTGLVHM